MARRGNPIVRSGRPAYAGAVLAPGEAGRDPDLRDLVEESWASRSHRDALSALVLAGWLPCGVGDWAVALRSPAGRLAARVSPFDPAYAAFVELCRRCGANRYLPRVELSLALEGGGSLTVLEFVAPAPEAPARQLVRRWQQDEGDAALRSLKVAALAVDRECRPRVPWWDGIDLHPGNVRRSAAGRLVVIDIFCLDGAALYGQLLDDAAVVRRRIPEGQRRHLLDIPYLARESSTDRLHALRAAWGR